MFELTVKLDSFEGPLELLYHLIEKNEIDIYDIPISELTLQYIEAINSLPPDMESLSSFLVMAATLLEIKSKMLLPSKNDSADEEPDPREELVKRLLEYKRFKEISEILSSIGTTLTAVAFRDADETIKTMFEPAVIEFDEILEGISLNTLVDVFADVLNRKELKVDRIRSTFGNVKKDKFTVEEKIAHLLDILRLRKRVAFAEFLESSSDKSEVVVTFLALLELIKMREVKISQKGIFQEIIIESEA